MTDKNGLRYIIKRKCALLLAVVMMLSLCVGCANANQSQSTDSTSNTVEATTSKEKVYNSKSVNGIDYTDLSNWAYYQKEAENADQSTIQNADLFILCPTVSSGSEQNKNMDITNEKDRSKFIGALNMELGIYQDRCVVYAPYYEQATMYNYGLDSESQEVALTYAYEDVKAAFEYYLMTCDTSRPLVLAGFSQGSDLLIRLMKDYLDDQELMNRLVAAYAIGWRLTEEDCKKYPQLKAATGETDTGVIITFNSEAEAITGSMMVPEGTKTLSINPLNWKTDNSVADASLNSGACFTDYSGNIKSETPKLCGAYIDETRGTLKVTGVTPEQYPPVLAMFSEGVYHLYDYQFFYRNLQENVVKRVEAFGNVKK